MDTEDIRDSESKVLLAAWRSGDLEARDRLFELLYHELRRVSGALIRAEPNSSLSSGDLVNDVVLRLMQSDQIEWNDRAHFMALAARTMRRVLVDQARKKQSDKRHHRKVTLLTHVPGAGLERIELDILEKALIRLSVLDAEKAQIVELRYYGGMGLDDIAEVMDISPSTVKRSWRVARAWLLNSLNEARRDEHRIS